MKFKKNWKRFWTLDRHHAEGFTLVELIVVIAILAILGGVAVPAYSGYVKKANMAADQTLVSEVANALVLAYYNGTMTGDGYVVLSDATPEFGGNAEVETALKDTFGDGWEALTLSYDGWSGGSSSEVIGILQTQGASAAEAVAGSTYANNVSQLLNDAQNCTSTLAKFLGNFTGGNMEDSFTKLEGNSQGLASVLAQAGLAKTEDGLNYDLIDADSVTNTQLSNALVLAIAGEVGNKADAQTSISNAWMSAAITGGWENTGMSVLADTAVRYAYYESITKSLNDSSLNTAFSTMNTAFSSATSEDAVYAAMGAMDSAIKNYMTANPDGNSALDNYFENQLATDAQALSSVMGAVDGVSDSFADSKILAQDNMYLSDNVANTVNSYVTAAKNYGSFPEGVEEGTVMIIFSSADAKATPVPNVY